MPLPSGTIKLKVLATTATVSGTWSRILPLPLLGGPITGAQWAAALSVGGLGSCELRDDDGVGTVTGYTFSGAIVLSGGNSWDGTYTDINDLPIKGITLVTSCQLFGTFRCAVGLPAANTCGVSILAPPNPATTISFAAGPSVQNHTYSFPSIPSLSNLASTPMGAKIVATAVQIELIDLYFIASYIVYQYNTNISNGVLISAPHSQTGKAFTNSYTETAESKLQISSGSLYSPSSPSNTGLNLTGSGVTGILFSWTDPTTGAFTTLQINSSDFNEDWTDSNISINFSLLSSLPSGIWIVIWVIGTALPDLADPYTGVTFSGSVSLGLLKILTTQSSGVYRIITDQTHDTLYIDNPTSNTTANFAIPDPFGKTGFIGG